MGYFEAAYALEYVPLVFGHIRVDTRLLKPRMMKGLVSIESLIRVFGE